jgi:hypothetical protein
LTSLNIRSVWLTVAWSLSTLALGMALPAGLSDVLRDQQWIDALGDV